MKLDNFKELLSKKAGDNQNLQLLIKYIKDDYLVDHVIESLNKMAAIHSNKNPNAAVMHFGTHMDPQTEGDMIHDALSHHASHYKAALKAGNEKLADAHMKKIFSIMHMSDKLTRDGLNDHSGGKLKIEAIDPKPWERSGYSKKTGDKFTTDTRGWGRSSSDYSWLRGAPHESYSKETSHHGHKGAYPLEEIKVNGKHLHIEDVEPTRSFVEHEFDKHPVMQHYSNSPKNHTEDNHARYIQDVEKFHSPGSTMDNYWDKVESRGDAHYNRGLNKPERIHPELPTAEESMQRLSDIQQSQPKQPSQQPSETLSGDEAMARLKQIMQGKKKI